jgi:UDPglucose--hexose-1-phosphate uridylyltransferase
VFKRTLTKPDGRALHLYGVDVQPEAPDAPAPPGAAAGPTHLRWHPLRGEWIAYAAHRQHRTFLPPPAYNPLAPMRDPAVPTELPIGTYDIAVFENLFPTFSMRNADDPPAAIVPTAAGRGVCEVVVFTQDPDATLGALPLRHIGLLFDVWADRTEALGALDSVQYVMPFENRGVEVGVTLAHPHGQIYAYPFVPPVPARELDQQRAHLAARGRGLLAELLDAELADARRVIWSDDRAIAVVPACARYAYEVWIAPRRPVASLPGLLPDERMSMARALKTVLLTYDHLWGQPFPYVMVLHQAPTDGAGHPEAHLHLEFYPAYRMRGRLKYLAGSELGAGVFTADVLPEFAASELQKARVDP